MIVEFGVAAAAAGGTAEALGVSMVHRSHSPGHSATGYRRRGCYY